MLLPEEPAPELGVKSKGLHFLTAGDQGVRGQARVGSRGWGRSVDSNPSTPAPTQACCACGRWPPGSVCTHSGSCRAPSRS